MVDEHGNVGPPPAESLLVLGGMPDDGLMDNPWFQAEPSRLELPGSIGARQLFARTFDALALGVAASHQRRRIKGALTQAGEAVPVARAPDGVVRVRGRVDVIDPVTLPPAGEPVAAFLRRERSGHPLAAMLSVRTFRDAGRFLVRDDTGAALVDDDFLELLNAPGVLPEATQSTELVVRAGDTVDVVGAARAVPMADFAQQGSYRDGARVLAFDGRHDQPVLVIVSRATGVPR